MPRLKNLNDPYVNDLTETYIMDETAINNPNYSSWSTLKIVSRILVLPLLWDACKWLFSELFGEKTGKQALQAQGITNIGLETVEDKELNARYLKVKTHDNVDLDTIEITSVRPKKQNPLYVINFLGTGNFYQDNQSFPLFKMAQDDAKNKQCTVIGFNYRHVGHSTKKAPKSQHDLVIDGITQVQRLLNKGVKPEQIVLNGVSMGSAVAILVAQHFHSKNIPVYLFVDRPFSSLSNTIAGWRRIGVFEEVKARGATDRVRIDDKTGYTESDEHLFSLDWTAKFGLSLTGWDMDIVKAYESIPDSHKELLYIRSPEHRRSESRPVDDAIIPESAALASTLVEPNNPNVHRVFTKAGEEKHDGHYKMRTDLVDEQGRTGQEIYYQFLYKVRAAQLGLDPRHGSAAPLSQGVFGDSNILSSNPFRFLNTQLENSKPMIGDGDFPSFLL